VTAPRTAPGPTAAGQRAGRFAPSTAAGRESGRFALSAAAGRESGPAASAGPGEARGRFASPGVALSAGFYSRPVLEVARDLVGCVVEHGGSAGTIVETEAYHQTEPACHAFAGLTPRTRTLFGPPGRAYVYRSYGIHAMLNAVCEAEGTGAAVLIRALEPLHGLEAMRERRGLERLEDLCSGPGKLCQALGIGLDLDGSDLADGPIRILAGETPPLVEGTRIGITKAADLPWRFTAAGSRFVSRPRPPESPPAP
jgi:DNA-3-methyladenine glycosylase